MKYILFAGEELYNDVCGAEYKANLGWKANQGFFSSLENIEDYLDTIDYDWYQIVNADSLELVEEHYEF